MSGQWETDSYQGIGREDDDDAGKSLLRKHPARAPTFYINKITKIKK